MLVGTTSVEKSELLSSLLSEQEIPHNLLNAKPENVERESEIVAQAGRAGAVTIATNMAGRGTDIILGGNSDYMARLKLREVLLARLVKPEDDHKPLCRCSAVPLQEVLLILLRLAATQQRVLPLPSLTQIDKALGQLARDLVKAWVIDPTVIELRKWIATAAEKAPTEDPQIQVLREAISRVKTEYDAVKQEEGRVRDAGGLHVIGTERHESRRADNQLRGRAGRQGDPGSTRFLSLGDNLLRSWGDRSPA